MTENERRDRIKKAIDKYLRTHEHEGRMPTVKQARKYGKTKRWRKQK